VFVWLSFGGGYFDGIIILIIVVEFKKSTLLKATLPQDFLFNEPVG